MSSNQGPGKRERSAIIKHPKDNYLPEQEIPGIISRLKEDRRFHDLSEEQLKIAVNHTLTEVTGEGLSGLFPHPAVLEGYEKVLQGTTHRIMAMVEENARNRHLVNHKIVEADIKRSQTGQVLSFVLSALFISASMICAYLKQPLPASVLGVSGFSSIISIFVLGKK